MFIFAHIFAGALLGLGFWHLTSDRRALPLCITASILPDLIDKSLGLAFPLVLGGGRTVFHSLLIVGVVLLLWVLLFGRSRFVLLGVGVACALLLHQIFDEMWLLPANWFYPLLGPFQGQMIPEYIRTFFWREITHPGEWMFMIGTVAILAGSYGDLLPRTSRSGTLITGAYTLVVAGLLIMGVYLVFTGLTSTAATFITPLYSQVPTVLAGALALCGAVMMRGEPSAAPRRAAP